jgi:hypothetical protein
MRSSIFGELFDVPLVEFTIEALGHIFNQCAVGYKWVDRSLVADKSLQRFFNRLGIGRHTYLWV